MSQILRKNIKNIIKYQNHISNKINEIDYDDVMVENGCLKVSVENNIFSKNSSDKIFLSPLVDTDISLDFFIEHNRKALNKMCVFIIGFGDGTYIREFLKQEKTKCIIIIEPREDVFNEVIRNFDALDIISNPKVTLYLGNNLQTNSFQKLLMSQVLFLREIEIVIHPLYEIITKNIINDLIHKIKKATIFLFTTIGNAPHDTLIGMSNTIDNLDYIINTPSLDEIKKNIEGLPIVVVSAGPSLKKNIDILKEIQDHVYIIAATTIQTKLFNNGIIPDGIAVLERNKEVYDMLFENKKMSKDVILFSQSLVNSRILKNYPGNIVTCFREHSLFEKNIAKVIGEINLFSAGSSVAHMNFGLASLLGASSIILMGQDLSYAEDGATHVDDTIYGDEKKESDLINYSKVGNEKKFVKTEGNNGQMVITNKLWMHFKYWFESEIVNRDIKVINCTEGGVVIKGTDVMTLKEATVKLNIMKQKKKNIVLDFPDDTCKAERKNNIKNYIKSEIKKYEYIDSLIEKNKQVLLELNEISLNKVYSKIESAFVKVNKINGEILNTSNLFNFIAQAYIITMKQNELLKGNVSSLEKLNEWISFQTEFLKSLKKILDIVLEMLEKAKKSLQY